MLEFGIFFLLYLYIMNMNIFIWSLIFLIILLIIYYTLNNQHIFVEKFGVKLKRSEKEKNAMFLIITVVCSVIFGAIAIMGIWK